MSKYDEMGAGREFDAVVAEKIFGRAPSHYECSHPWFCCCPVLPRYSTRIDKAWYVIDKLKTSGGWGLHALSSCCPHNTDAQVVLCNDFNWAFAEGDNPAHAICRAALKAMEAKT